MPVWEALVNAGHLPGRRQDEEPAGGFPNLLKPRVEVKIKLERAFENSGDSGTLAFIFQAMPAASTTRIPENPPAHDTRFDRRLAEILDYATEIFADKGYEGASMRDLSRLSGTSLAGLYYYFESKEKLLYFIQKHTFTTIIQRLRERLTASDDPEERLRIFVQNHVDYAIARPKAMKVLSHEDDVLKNSYGAELAAIKREYYRICVELVDELVKAEGLSRSSSRAAGSAGAETRTAVMALFGAMNWLYTWYKLRVDPDAGSLARQISDLFLQGIRGGLPGAVNLAGKTAKSGGKKVERAGRELQR